MKWILSIFFISLIITVNAQCIEGDCENGFGKFTCDCGYVFEGEFRNGQKFKGTLTKEDLVYTGEFKNDIAEGFGIMRYKDGSWYEGTFMGNVPHGYGTYSFGGSQIYTGEINAGAFQGLGVQVSKDKEGRIEEIRIGYFENDQLNGVGCAIVYGGNTYLGEFSKGDFLGFGAYIHKEQGTAEAGKFKKNKLQENVILLDYPTADNFGVKDYFMDGYQFNLTGNIFCEDMELRILNSKKELMLIYFDSKKELFYMSEWGAPQKGKIINYKGEIFDGMVNLETSEVIKQNIIYTQRE
jgi:hypothetical protein